MVTDSKRNELEVLNNKIVNNIDLGVELNDKLDKIIWWSKNTAYDI